MQTLEYPVIPEIGGTEEEERIDIYFSNPVTKVDSFVMALDEHGVRSLMEAVDPFCGILPGSNEYLSNGARFYHDRGIELATPECANPLQQAAYITANAELLIRGLGDYVATLSQNTRQTNVKAVVQRRVIDSEGHTWGCHDNHSIRKPNFEIDVYNDPRVKELFNSYLTSRSFITGAGYIGHDGAYFSQKMMANNAYSAHGTKPSLVNVKTSHGQRLEDRSNDINLFDWATTARIGGMALVVAAAQTPLVKRLTGKSYYQFKLPRSEYNRVPLNADLQLRSSENLTQLVDHQRFVFETILKYFEKDTGQKIPLVYSEIATSILQYCGDVVSVMNGIDDPEKLNDRVDWSNKLSVVRTSVKRKPLERRLTDARSKALDMHYDRITVESIDESSEDEESAVVTRGYGYGLAEEHRLNKQSAIERATIEPPRTTRAYDRVTQALRLGNAVTDCSWDEIRYTRERKPMRPLRFDSYLRTVS